jgi:peptidoglycan/LPS O-acetylase OafA/YrhL
VLSGFLLYRPFAAAHLAGNSVPDSRRFYERRFLRIMPAYWAVLVFVTVVFRNVDLTPPSVGVRHALLLDSYSSAWVRNDRWMQQTWSLATEVLFYALLPLLAFGAFLVVRRARRGVRAELALVAVLGAVSFGIAWWLAAARPDGTVAVVWFPAQAYLFALGMAIAIMAVAPPGRAHAVLHRAARPAGCWLALAAGAYLLVVFGLDLPDGFSEQASVGQALGQRALYALIAVALVVPGVFGAGGATRAALSWKPLRWIGLISYGVFLWHLDIVKQLEDWELFTPPTTAGRFVVVVLATVVLSLAAAAVLWAVVERPLQHRGRLRRPRAVEQVA